MPHGVWIQLLDAIDAPIVGEPECNSLDTGCTCEFCTQQIIDAVVPLHAKFWGHPEDLTVKSVPRIDSEAQSAGITAGCEAGWDPCMSRFGHVVDR